jgi:uncharacterized protein YbaP (TraB family)
MSLRLASIAILFAACWKSGSTVPTSKLADLDDSYLDDDMRRVASERACPEVKRPWLWRVEGGGTTSFLFGTYPVGVGRDRLPTSVTEAFASARTLVVETTDDDALVEKWMWPQSKRSLHEELGSTAWARLEALFGKQRAARMDELSPAAVIAVLATMYTDLETGLPEQLESAARERGLQVVGLASAGEITRPVHRWLDGGILRAYLLASRGRRHLREHLLADLAAYCEGQDVGDGRDFLGIENLLPADQLDRMEHDFSRSLNATWVTRLEPVLAAGNAFVAVGVARLDGPGGIADLLRRRGFRVTRVEGSSSARGA